MCYNWCMHYRTRRILSNILSSILVTLIVLIGFFSILTISLNVVYIKTKVEGYSMLPTLNLNVEDIKEEGDIVYINRFKKCKVGDIVVARYEEKDKYVIKRLVGCPGDYVKILDNGETYGLYVNNELLYSKNKTYSENENIGSTVSYYNFNYLTFFNRKDDLGNKFFENNIAVDEQGDECIKLNEGEYFLMGDNWGRTTDSLDVGPFKENQIIGSVDIVVPFGENEDSYILNLMKNMLLY